MCLVSKKTLFLFCTACNYHIGIALYVTLTGRRSGRLLINTPWWIRWRKCLLKLFINIILLITTWWNFKRNINPDCSFCEDHPETVLQLFWDYSHFKKFWQDFSRTIIDHVHGDFALMWEDMVFCFFRKQRKEEKYLQ